MLTFKKANFCNECKSAITAKLNLNFIFKNIPLTPPRSSKTLVHRQRLKIFKIKLKKHKTLVILLDLEPRPLHSYGQSNRFRRKFYFLQEVLGNEFSKPKQEVFKYFIKQEVHVINKKLSHFTIKYNGVEFITKIPYKFIKRFSIKDKNLSEAAHSCSRSILTIFYYNNS